MCIYIYIYMFIERERERERERRRNVNKHRFSQKCWLLVEDDLNTRGAALRARADRAPVEGSPDIYYDTCTPGLHNEISA